MITRPVARSDISLICLHREHMFREASISDDNLAAMAAPFRQWLERRLGNGAYFGFVVEEEGRPIAAIGLMVIDWPPHPAHPADDQSVYLHNLFI
jgi:hypothetical protein